MGVEKVAKKKMTFAVLGGDLRQVRLIELLVKDHYNVKAFGFENIILPKEVEISNTFEKEIFKDVDVFIGPVPCSHDKLHLNAVYIEQKILLKDIFEKLPPGKLFIGGKIDDFIQQMALKNNIKVIDLLEREELAVLNVIPTAEGAIQIAMENIETTIHGSKTLILGFGRIGKILGKMLLGIGAEVTIEARKLSDLAWIEAYGYESLHLKQLKESISSFDLIFNTIPSKILDQEILQFVNKDALIIDLSSNPGGVDFEYAKEIGIRALSCLSLPGKVAPLTASMIIKNTIFNIYEEVGVNI